MLRRGPQEYFGEAQSVAFDVTLLIAITGPSFGQTLVLSRWLAADARAERAGASQAGPSRQDGADL